MHSRVGAVHGGQYFGKQVFRREADRARVDARMAAELVLFQHVLVNEQAHFMVVVIHEAQHRYAAREQV